MSYEYDDWDITKIFGDDILPRIEDAFGNITGMTVVLVDHAGRITGNSDRIDPFCSEYIWMQEEGRMKCELCFKYSMEEALRKGVSEPYVCHAGLLECAIPISLEGKLLGGFIIGQLRTEVPSEAVARQRALEQGIAFKPYWMALQTVKVVEEKKFRQSCQFLRSIGDILSDIAKGKMQAIETGKEMERVANMKSDFLANMSHEIRTPMNAVIGMSEMALREDLPPTARDYITQIKSSGKALLNIINDILDISKIESGKMTVTPVEYEPLSLFTDVSNIIMTRVTDKDVDIVLSVEPKLPKLLYGDNLRIRQVLINLANNAVKFTQKGYAKIIVTFEKNAEDEIQLRVAVEDTGIGIKEADMGKLFGSFQQLDSKRNRNIEGTGLGLAISRQLVELMGGSMQVESVYEEGSTFSFTLPQKVVDWSPSMSVPNASEIVAFGTFANAANAREFYQDTNRLGIFSITLIEPEDYERVRELYQKELLGKKVFLFSDKGHFQDKIQKILEEDPDMTGVLLLNPDDSTKCQLPNLRIMRKPMSTLGIVNTFNGEETHYIEVTEDSFEFIAPDAKVLIVDDNAINLTIAEGLLEPLCMQIDTADSGKEALDKIEQVHYDIIFMDHMMPELDGIETTRIIRRLHPECNDIPIIALTANAIGGVKELFLSEGMNDFVAKPIELRVLVNMVKKWLPVEKIKRDKGESREEEKKSGMEEHFDIADLDTESARKLLGSDKLFWTVLREYYKNIPGKSKKIRDFVDSEDWANYTIEVHALKSSSKQIGAFVLARMAEQLEAAGNARDLELIRNSTPIMLAKYESYMEELAAYCVEEEKTTVEKRTVSKDELLALLTEMKEAADNLDIDVMEEKLGVLDGFLYDEVQMSLLEQLREAVDNIDVDTCTEIVVRWEALLG